jgi:flagellar P-ring protein FlgI
MKKLFCIAILSFLLNVSIFAQQRIKDISHIKGIESRQLIGYGLVVGLDGTGDGQKSQFTVQAVANMLMRLGITVTTEEIKLKNVASVIVTATVPAFAMKGSLLDVTVSSLGDAKSLEGGILLLSPLKGTDGQVYAYAQGAVSIGGFNIKSEGGEQFRKNYTLVGRVAESAQLLLDVAPEVFRDNKISIILKDPDFTTANQLSIVINQRFNSSIAVARTAGEIEITIPDEYKAPEKTISFLSEMEVLPIQTDRSARIVINERTGTIVIGEQVKISPVAVAHGNLNVEIRSSPIISQPSPMSGGITTVVPRTTTQVTTDNGRLLVIENAINVKDVARALNALGVTPRDLIAIFQALKQAGALNAELIVM